VQSVSFKTSGFARCRLSVACCELKSISKHLFGILDFGHCNLPFDLAQGGGELVEPFGICVLLFEIF